METPVTENQLLLALPPKEFNALRPKLERTALTFESEIYGIGDAINYVYFPNDGIISMLAGVSADLSLEIGFVGNEGMVGLPLFFGVDTSFSRKIVQVPGTAMRMSARDFLTECSRSDIFSRVLLRFTHFRLIQNSQSAVCVRFHTLEQRLARLILTLFDRSPSNEFQITQLMLSKMLGVRREAVNKSVGLLQRSGYISYGRGRVIIIDHLGLETAACKCYQIINEFLSSFPRSN